MATKKKTDLSAALTGLILGAMTLFLVLTAIVMMIRNRTARINEPSSRASPRPVHGGSVNL